MKVNMDIDWRPAPQLIAKASMFRSMHVFALVEAKVTPNIVAMASLSILYLAGCTLTGESV